MPETGRLGPSKLTEHGKDALARGVPPHVLRVRTARSITQLEGLDQVAQEIEQRDALLELPRLVDRNDVPVGDSRVKAEHGRNIWEQRLGWGSRPSSGSGVKSKRA